MVESRRALVLGGAGFVGSAISHAFVSAGWRVSVIDGLVPGTFADRARIADIESRISFVHGDVSVMPELAAHLADSDVIVNCIGWTRHIEAERDPARDLTLNLAVHVDLLMTLAAVKVSRYIHLGSRHQFGAPGGVIDDDAPFAPIDVQSIHKTAAEHHVRRFAQRTGTKAIALRTGNCFGPGLPIDDGDVGLIGGFMRDLMRSRTVTVYDGERRRNVCFTPDLATIVTALASAPLEGFVGLNYPGLDVDVGEIAGCIRSELGCGAIVRAPMPEDVARRELGAARFTSSTLPILVPGFSSTPLETAIAVTVRSLVAARACCA